MVGCGFGGVEVARTVRTKAKDLDVIMIDRSTRFDYQPSYPELLSGKVTPEEISSDLTQFATKIGAKFVHAEVLTVDFKNKTVKTKAITSTEDEEKHIPYDFLVLAIGAEQTFFGIPGAEEFSYTVNTLEGSLETKNVLDTLDYAKEPTIMIIGAGLTGVEVAGELVDYFIDRAVAARINLVEMMPRMLPACPYGNVASCVAEFLCARGVEALTETAVQEVGEKEITFKDGRKHPYDLLIWTAGIKPNVLLEKLDLPKVKGWIKVDSYLRVEEGLADVFAVGDTAYVERDGACSGQNVEEAMGQGKAAAKNIIRTTNGKNLKEYKQKNTLQNPRAFISLGDDKAVVYSGRFMSKLFGYRLKKFVERRYMKRFK